MSASKPSAKPAQTPRQKATKKIKSPARQKVIDVNINDQVLIRLTDHGRECLLKNYDQLKAIHGGKFPFPFKLPKEDNEGRSRWQLWRLLEEFGPHMHMGSKLPFETKISIEIGS